MPGTPNRQLLGKTGLGTSVLNTPIASSLGLVIKLKKTHGVYGAGDRPPTVGSPCRTWFRTLRDAGTTLKGEPCAGSIVGTTIPGFNMNSAVDPEYSRSVWYSQPAETTGGYELCRIPRRPGRLTNSGLDPTD